MIEKNCRNELLQLAKQFAKQHDISLATASREAHGSDKFIQRFVKGQVTVTLSKYDEMVAFFRAGKRKPKADLVQ